METILNQIPSAKDEFRGWARECKVYRNQGWRNGILTYRLGNVSKAEYVTYQMPNGRIFRTAVDMVAEQHGQTMKVATRDMATTKTYYFCDEDNYGQRTGTYQSIELSHDDIMLDRHGNLYHNGHFLYKSEEEIIIACSK
jgi:hypothetical protein